MKNKDLKNIRENSDADTPDSVDWKSHCFIINELIKHIDDLEEEKNKYINLYKSRGTNIEYMQNDLHKKNLKLNSLYYVWCSGGCDGGAGKKVPSREIVEEAIRNTDRLIQWHNNFEFRKMPLKDKMDYHKFVKENREEREKGSNK